MSSTIATALKTLDNPATPVDPVISSVLPPFLTHGHRHWFCLQDCNAKTEEEKKAWWDAAVFLLVLWRYKAKDLILQWRDALQEILGQDGCEKCMRLYSCAKRELGQRFLRQRYDLAVVKQYYTVSAQKEANILREKYAAIPLPPRIGVRILNDLSLCYKSYFLDPLIQNPCPSSEAPESPLLLLTFHEKESVRSWALMNLETRSKLVDSKEWEGVKSHLFAIFGRLGRLYNDLTLGEMIGEEYNPFVTAETFSFSDDREVFWSSLSRILPHFSPDVLPNFPNRVRQFLTSHLGDKGPEVEYVLKCAAFLMESSKGMFWEGLKDRTSKGDRQSYPAVVLNRLLSNPAFEIILKNSTLSSNPFEAWLDQFILSVPTSSRMECLRYASSTLWGTYQHPSAHYTSVVHAILSGVKLWTNVMKEWMSSETIAGELYSILELHIEFLAQVTFKSEKRKEFKDRMQRGRSTLVVEDEAAKEWKEITKRVAAFLGMVILQQAEKVERFTIQLSKSINQLNRDLSLRKMAMAKGSDGKNATVNIPPVPVLKVPPRPAVSVALGNKIFQTLKTEKSVTLGLVQMIPVVAATSFVGITDPPKPSEQYKNASGTVQWTSVTLKSFRNGFTELIDKDQTGKTVKEILSNGGKAGKCLIKLLFSPVEEIQSAVTNAFQETFDAPDRLDLFRQLFKLYPDATLAGIRDVLDTFIGTAKYLVEATGFSKRLVRCLNDVIEVLCDSASSPKGFFHDMKWRKSMNMSESSKDLWALMCQATAIIYERTPSWSPFYSSSDMIEWMRDVVAFQEVMVNNVRAFQSVSSDTTLSASPMKPTTVSSEKSFISDLNVPLEKVTGSWLRLNDEHLLASVTDLICKAVTLFARANVPLSDVELAELKKYIEKGLDGRPVDKKSTLLNTDQITSILTCLLKHPTQGGPFKKILEDMQLRATSGSNVIEILDDDDDDNKIELDVPPPAPRQNISTSSIKPTAQQTPAFARDSRTDPSRASVPSNVNLRFPRQTATSRDVRDAPPSARAAKQPSSNDSSEEDSESDSEDEGGLAALGKIQKSPVRLGPQLVHNPAKNPFAPPPPAVRQTKMIDISGKVMAKRPVMTEQQRIQEEYKRRQNRFKLCAKVSREFDELYRMILKWDPRLPGEFYPGFQGRLQSVPHSFKDVKEYSKIFHPLLMTECWQQIVKARSDTDAAERQPISVRITDRSNIDDFVELGVVPININEENVEKIQFTEVDLVELSFRGNSILAKISNVTMKKAVLELKMVCSLGGQRVGMDLVPGSEWSLVKVTSLSTIMREFAALRTLPYLEMTNDILKPVLPPKPKTESALISHIMKTYRVNDPQATAIAGSLQTKGFSLIQGPPGTGKTSTIIGLVGAFLHESKLCGRPPGRKPKLLLCAPSNAAVDEVVKRLKEGVRDNKGTLYQANVVRVGSENAVNIAVRDVFIDSLVDKRLDRESAGKNVDGVHAEIKQLAAQIEEIKITKSKKREEEERVFNNQALATKLETEIRSLTVRSNNLYQQLQTKKDSLRSTYRARDDARVKARRDVLNEADVICATLSGSGHDYMSQIAYEFDTVIIDEAAQSVEISSLIPMRYGCTKCILVGDPNQLPPTVISNEAAKCGYNNSIFVRLQAESAQNAYLLSIQYRMHSTISSFPSKQFYDSRLKDGPGMDAKTQRPWHQHSLFPTYQFLDVEGREEKDRYNSMVNTAEVNIALQLYKRLREICSGTELDYQVGIVSPYKGQVHNLRRTFQRSLGDNIIGKVDFNTVDGFQGQEKDIIILSLVRGGNDDGGVGFLKDTRRMNVALTRARSSLFILGNAKHLRQNSNWKTLLEDAESRDALKKCTKYTFAEQLTPMLSHTPSASSPVFSTKTSPRKGTAAKRTQLDSPFNPPNDELLTPSQIMERRRGNSKPQSIATSMLKRKVSAVSTEEPRKRHRNSEKGEAESEGRSMREDEIDGDVQMEVDIEPPPEVKPESDFNHNPTRSTSDSRRTDKYKGHDASFLISRGRRSGKG